MLGVINDIDVIYLEHITQHLEKEYDTHMQSYWMKELREYVGDLGKRLKQRSDHDLNFSQSHSHS